jgi:hypothetical protein
MSFTYGHRTLKTELPVRSAVLKQGTGGLVVEFVRIGESPLLYVFAIFAGVGRHLLMQPGGSLYRGG